MAVGYSIGVDNAADLGEKDYRFRAGYINKIYCKEYLNDKGETFWGGSNILEREHDYSVGDFVFSNQLPAWAYMVCVGAGKTDISSVILSSVQENDLVGDGTVTWEVKRFDGRQTISPTPVMPFAMPPAHYSRNRKFMSITKTSISTPSVMWVDINNSGYILGSTLTKQLSVDSDWDTAATVRESNTNYEIDDCIIPHTGKQGYIYRCITAGVSSKLLPLSYPTNIGDTLVDGDVEWICEPDYTNPTNRRGHDFYIYACVPENGNVPVILLSANSTYPAKYDSTTSRKIGGFHCECADVGTIANHSLSGLMAGDVIPTSIWDLNHRPVSEPEGMVYVDGLGLWVDIYLASWDGEKLVSAYGADIADGDSVKPFHGELFAEEAGKIGKRLLDRDEFIVCAKGSNEQTNIKGSADAVTAGGHVDTNNRRMISNYGLEECCGYMWQWLRNVFSVGLNAASYCPTTSGYPQTATVEGYHYINNMNWLTDGRGTSNIKVDGKQSIYGNCYGALVRLIAGSSWGGGSHCGSRSVAGNDLSSIRPANFGVRLASEPRAV